MLNCKEQVELLQKPSTVHLKIRLPITKLVSTYVVCRYAKILYSDKKSVWRLNVKKFFFFWIKIKVAYILICINKKILRWITNRQWTLPNCIHSLLSLLAQWICSSHFICHNFFFNCCSQIMYCIIWIIHDWSSFRNSFQIMVPSIDHKWCQFRFHSIFSRNIFHFFFVVIQDFMLKCSCCKHRGWNLSWLQSWVFRTR